MWTRFLSFAAVLGLMATCASQAAEKPRSPQANQNHPKKVWTNEDLDQLRPRGLISIVGQQENTSSARTASSTAQAPTATTETTFPIYASRLDDPRWYANESANLQAELATRKAALRQQQAAIVMAKDRATQPGLAVDKGDAGVTPAAGIANLEAKVQEVQSQLDELGDLARQHGIEPGVLRS
jgi:hypothetical protein